MCFPIIPWLCVWISRRHPGISLDRFPRYDLKEYSEGSPVGDLAALQKKHLGDPRRKTKWGCNGGQNEDIVMKYYNIYIV